MPLTVTLKAHEKVIIGGAVVTNKSPGKAELIIENHVPVLRQADVLTASEADTPCKRIYLAIQLMYVDGTRLQEHQCAYWKLVRELLEAASSTAPVVQAMSSRILSGDYFRALKLAKKLIRYEEEATRHVRHAHRDL